MSERWIEAIGGFVFLKVLPWIFSGLCLLVAVAAWTGVDRQPRPAGSLEADSDELRTARLALEVSKSENETLRSELDRLLRKVSGKPAVKDERQSTADLVTEVTERAATVREFQDKAEQALSAGNNADAAKAITDLANLGPAAIPALEELYRKHADPAIRLLLVPPLMMVGGKSMGMQFVMEELEKNDDPKMRGNLLLGSAMFADPETAPALKDHWIGAIYDPQATSGLRRAAVGALANVEGPEAENALLAAAGDSNPYVRIAAFERLAAREGTRERLRELLAGETFPVARQIGECQLLIAETAP